MNAETGFGNIIAASWMPRDKILLLPFSMTEAEMIYLMLLEPELWKQIIAKSVVIKNVGTGVDDGR